MHHTTPQIPRPTVLPRGATALMHDDAWSARARLASNDPALAGPDTLPLDDDAQALALDNLTRGLDLSPQIHTLMLGALRLGEQRMMRENWWWGFTCGGFAIGLIILIGMNAGRALGWWLL